MAPSSHSGRPASVSPHKVSLAIIDRCRKLMGWEINNLGTEYIPAQCEFGQLRTLVLPPW